MACRARRLFETILNSPKMLNEIDEALERNNNRHAAENGRKKTSDFGGLTEEYSDCLPLKGRNT